MVTAYRLKILTRAAYWDRENRPDRLLLETDYARMIAVYWRMKHKTDLPQFALDFIEVGYQKVDQHKWEHTLNQRDYCSCHETDCNDSWKLENLSVCVECGKYWICHRVCSCGGELAG